MKLRLFKGRRGDEISFEVNLWPFSVTQHCPNTLMEQGKRRSAEQGLLDFLPYAKEQCESLTRAWFLDERNSSHFSGFISNLFNVIVKRNRHKVCFGTAHCVASLSSKLPTAHFFKRMHLPAQQNKNNLHVSYVKAEWETWCHISAVHSELKALLPHKRYQRHCMHIFSFPY